ncbi:C40 family peptidase [Pseudonocardia endophytica]|uniref:Cell wall-associated NlpC family hydrolase n=1 Tax=Pseudonocardia endophytica TaxID=401976 RepID=A0A4R1HJ37_PSEEN|nr:cell wall-associated NlpC family hydrolase [Pseudonocardia endophytica]
MDDPVEEYAAFRRWRRRWCTLLAAAVLTGGLPAASALAARTGPPGPPASRAVASWQWPGAGGGPSASPAPAASPTPAVAPAPVTSPAVPERAAPVTGADVAPSGRSSTVARVAVAFAMAQRGLPYVWGGNGPADGDAGFDCSGLSSAAYERAGVGLPRTAHAQFASGPRLPGGSEPLLGDLVFYGTPDDVHHVGIALGNGRMINAPTFGQPVRTSWYRWPGDDYIGATRPSALPGTLAFVPLPPRWAPAPRRQSPEVFAAPPAGDDAPAGLAPVPPVPSGPAPGAGPIAPPAPPATPSRSAPDPRLTPSGLPGTAAEPPAPPGGPAAVTPAPTTPGPTPTPTPSRTASPTPPARPGTSPPSGTGPAPTTFAPRSFSSTAQPGRPPTPQPSPSPPQPPRPDRQESPPSSNASTRPTP